MPPLTRAAVRLADNASQLLSTLPGFTLTPAVAVGMGAAIAAVLRLPLTAIVLATLLTANAGIRHEALIIVGVVVSYLVTLVISPPAPAASPDRDGTVTAQTLTPVGAAPSGAPDRSPNAPPTQ